MKTEEKLLIQSLDHITANTNLPLYSTLIGTVAEYNRARNGVLNLNEKTHKELVRQATERLQKATRELTNLAQACITIEDRTD